MSAPLVHIHISLSLDSSLGLVTSSTQLRKLEKRRDGFRLNPASVGLIYQLKLGQLEPEAEPTVRQVGSTAVCAGPLGTQSPSVPIVSLCLATSSRPCSVLIRAPSSGAVFLPEPITKAQELSFRARTSPPVSAGPCSVRVFLLLTLCRGLSPEAGPETMGRSKRKA